jgi:1-deoxy-D-xylulose-5-phosphate reductoisomerase
MKKKIAILGSTGSIGTQTLDVISYHPERFQVEALSAGRNIDLLIKQALQFQPKLVTIADSALADKVKSELPETIRVLYGQAGLIEAAACTDADLVVTALVGSQGLQPTIAAIESGKHIGLANKETLVTAGHIIKQKLEKYKVSLLPIDSEHSAIFQCLNGESLKDVSKLILTASGGSFRDRTRDELKGVTVEEALNHPNWSMGAKITIDSATMMNKGLEVIEAHWLFDIPYDQIEVVIHPQSIIHSMVQFQDHSVMAQLGLPDMRVPIQYALTYPKRLSSPSKPMSLTDLSQLDFRVMNEERYPCLKMAFEAGKAGGTMPTVFNAANEIAVERFLKGDMDFLHIETIIDKVLEQHHVVSKPDLEQIGEADAWARLTASCI